MVVQAVRDEPMAADSQRILLVEDDLALAQSIREYLQEFGYTVLVEPRGDEAITTICSEDPDMLILDLMLPGLDGLSICRQVRGRYRRPILMLTARGEELDQIVGLEVGADDYVAKPVRPRLLLARVRALLRRNEVLDGMGPDSVLPDASNTSVTGTAAGVDEPGQPVPGQAVSMAPIQPAVGQSALDPGLMATAGATVLVHGDLRIELVSRSVFRAERELALTTAEFDLLHYLAKHAGRVITREELYRSLRGVEYDGLDRSMDLRISRLRGKLGDDSDDPRRIKTVRGVGYIFALDQ